MAGKITFSLQEFQEAAHKFRPQLLRLPIITLRDRSLKYFTERPGIRYKESVGTIDADVELAPYKASYRHDLNPEIIHRTLETFLGCTVEDFEPNATISTLLGITGDTKGDGQKNQPSAVAALSLIAQKIGEKLNKSLFSAERNNNGTTTAELFNGFDTITATEITAGNITVAKKNLIELSEPITKLNAYDILTEEVLYKLTDEMRDQELSIYCAQSILDKYNQAYFATHGHVPFYKEYGQNVLEGSDGKIKFVPLVGKAGSEFLHISNKDNMLVGYDQMGDMESVSIEKYAPFILTFVMTMFFGTEFESIDAKRLQVVKLAASSSGESSGENSGESSGENSGGNSGGSSGESSGGNSGENSGGN